MQTVSPRSRPVDVTGLLRGETVCIFTAEGELKWQKQRAVELKGSFEANVHASCCPITGKLVIDGNPVKYFQGHNVFGSEDIHGLAYAIITHVMDALGLPALAPSDLEEVEVARVDLTGMYSVGTAENARAAVRVLAERATMHYRGRGTMTRDGTVYFGKHSRRNSTKVYAKGHELRDHKLPEDLPNLESITSYAQDKLRIEHVLRRMYLVDAGLDRLRSWGCDTSAKLFADLTEKLNVADNIELSNAQLEGMKPRLRLAYSAWLRGDDLRATLPTRTFTRYRRELLELGVDLLTLQPAEERRPMLRLVEIIRAVPATPPTWAYGTPSLFEPRKTA
jgi:II/X family phage/plasmid replication protein